MDWAAKKNHDRKLLIEKEMPCASCPNFGSIWKGRVFCDVNAACGDPVICSTVSFTEASTCPGPELRALFLSAPTYYATRRQDSS